MVERIPEEKINEIRQSVDIVELISEFVHLKKQGRNYFGLCPFHGESTPSFSVSPDKQIFHCFGCHAGGNVFSFLMDIEGISFQEAAIKLAERGNIHLQIDSSPISNPVSKENEQMIQAYEQLSKFYHHLLVNTNEGQEALEYLTNRGFTREVIDHFQIGFALNKRDMGLNFLKRRGYSEEFLERSGLVIKSEHSNEYFDRFRERIIFPIFDNKGNTVAFSGRILTEGQPKYLNSPETIIFHKSKTLYNFHKARPNIRKKQSVVLFEGFADCISAFRAGIDNGIATMGTALTEDHVNIIKRNTNQVILCFDADAAGQTATMKAGELLQAAGCHVQVAMIPNGKDPDEYIKTNGPKNFVNEVIGSSLTFMAFKLKYYRLGKNLQNEGEKLNYIENVLNDISKLGNAVEQEMYLRQLAEEFSLSLDVLKQQVRKMIFQSKKGNIHKNNPPLQKVMVVHADKKLKPAYYNAERMLIAHMLKSVQFTYKVQEKLAGTPFNVDDHQAIATYLYAFYETGNEPDLSHFLTFLQDDQLRKVTAEIGMLSINDEITEREWTDYIYNVLKYQKMQKIKEKEEEQKQAEREKNYTKAAVIANEILQLRKML
ncbi:DNA primase [Caldibacillus lycopersici]|uniref:DNA primase n=1 Tax=Perspicuibacillus lycopersici TaxID=1325689 RepID=A0AAE3ISZ8_9BACI|nr:DNA primase [Perspicuibacillus lycopersici]MCU9613906.1 DNA primase [Perspicuibacillus lycopersici]